MLKNRSMKPIVIAILVIAGLALSFSFPYLIFSYENHNLDGYGIQYESKPVKINSDVLTFSDKLQNMTQFMDDYSYLFISSEKIYTSGNDVKLTHDRAKNLAIEAYSEIFVTDRMLSDLKKNRNEFKEYLKKQSDVFEGMYLFIKTDTKDMFLAWDIEITGEYGSVEIILDDDTGKLLTAYFYTADPDLMEGYIRSIEEDSGFSKRLADYYDMTYSSSDNSEMSIDNTYSDMPTKVSIRNVSLKDKNKKTISLQFIGEDYGDSDYNAYFNYFSSSEMKNLLTYMDVPVEPDNESYDVYDVDENGEGVEAEPVSESATGTDADSTDDQGAVTDTDNPDYSDGQADTE